MVTSVSQFLELRLHSSNWNAIFSIGAYMILMNYWGSLNWVFLWWKWFKWTHWEWIIYQYIRWGPTAAITRICVSYGLCHLILLMFAQFSQCHSALLMNIGLIYVKSMYGMMYLASMDIKMIKTIDGIGSAFVKVCFGKNQWKSDGMFHVWCLISSLAVLALLCWFSTVN